MKLIAKAGLLRNELALAMPIIPDKPPIPSTAGVLLTAEAMDTHAGLASTDTAIALRGRFEAKIEEPGAMVLPGRKLFDILKTLQMDTDVVLTQTETDAKIKAGSFSSRLNTFLPADYPKIPEPDGLPGVLLPRAGLRTMIERTRFCVKGSGSQAYDLAAMLILKAAGADGQRMTMIATDSHRLSVASSLGPHLSATITELIPRPALTQLDQALDGDGADVEFMQTEAHLFFRIGDRLIVSRRVEGKYPAWERIVPKNKLTMQTDRQAMGTILKRVSLIVDGVGSRQVRFSLTRDRLSLAAASVQVGDGEDSVSVAYAQEDTAVALNPGYVMDFLEVVGADKVQMETDGPKSPVLWRPFGPTADDFLYVVMPMNMAG